MSELTINSSRFPLFYIMLLLFAELRKRAIFWAVLARAVELFVIDYFCLLKVCTGTVNVKIKIDYVNF